MQMVPEEQGSGVSQGAGSDVLSSAGRDHGTESCGASLDKARSISYLSHSSTLSLTNSAFLCQAWTMSAMKTSSPTPPRIRFPSNMSSLKDFFSMTRQKVIA